MAQVAPEPDEKLNIQTHQHVVVSQEAQCIETTRFSDRHFWHGGYDKADAAAALTAGLSPGRIADARRVRVSTVRTLLQRAQEKAGAGTLRDLVGTLAALRA